MASIEEKCEIKVPFDPKGLTAEMIVRAYRREAINPVPVAGKISSAVDSGKKSGVQMVETRWSQRDIDRKENTRFVKTYTLQVETGSDGGQAHSQVGCSLPQQISNV